MPIPPQLTRVLKRLLGVDVQPHVGARGLGGGVGEHDAGSEVPDGAFAVGFDGLEVAFDMRPIPIGLVLLVVLAGLLLHVNKMISSRCNLITHLTVRK